MFVKDSRIVVDNGRCHGKNRSEAFQTNGGKMSRWKLFERAEAKVSCNVKKEK